MLFIFTCPLSIHQNCSFISLWKYEKELIFRLAVFDSTDWLTTRAQWRKESGGWNKLIFLQQRTFITHSADDIFPFSYKIESHSSNHTCSIPLVQRKRKVLWRDQFKLSTFSTRMSSLPPLLLLSSEGWSLSCIYVFRQFTRWNYPS